MIVFCTVCGKPVERKRPGRKSFCSDEHRNLWLRENVDYSKLSRLHKAPNLTELNRKRNPLCQIAERGKADSSKARAIAELYLGRELEQGEVVHHMNGNSEDNRPENLLVMPDRQHKRLHMALAIEKLNESGEAGDK